MMLDEYDIGLNFDLIVNVNVNDNDDYYLQ